MLLPLIVVVLFDPVILVAAVAFAVAVAAVAVADTIRMLLLRIPFVKSKKISLMSLM